MPSEQHAKKVEAICQFFDATYGGGKGWIICIDHESDELPPWMLGNHRPDFFAKRYAPRSTFIVGEAKKNGGFRDVSKRQIKTFVTKLSEQNALTAFVLCVGLNDIPKVKQFIKKDLAGKGVVIHLIDETMYEHYQC